VKLDGGIRVPDDWGIWQWYSLNDGNMSFERKRRAKQLYPKPVDRYFLASLLRQGNTAKKGL